MNIRILHWKDDKAATNISNNLKEIGLGNICVQSPKSLLFTTQKELEGFVKDCNKIDYFIVASTHRSETAKLALTVHPTGNFGKSDLGGNLGELSKTWSAGMKIGLQYYARHSPEGFDITMEATHHGPTDWEKPLMFIEIGSTEKEWIRKDLGILAANAIKEIVEKAPKAKFENYAGFGGIHYCPSFNKIQIENEKAAIGHIVPKYAEDAITEDIVKQALEKSFAKKAIIDWKGIKSVAREKVVAALENLGIEYFKTGNFEKINNLI
ncbi:TPA: hypothetical protein H1009_02350 [archaeon]|nr:hypothetical protein [Candidatus Naiadarchaeales archaeon SRR2090153.bin461]